MTVDDCEHFLIKLIEEFVHHVGEIELATEKIPFEFHKQLAEHIRVLLVNHAVSLLEHLVEAISGLLKKRFEEF